MSATIKYMTKFIDATAKIQELERALASEKELSDTLRHNIKKERERGNRAYSDADGFKAQYENSRVELAEVVASTEKRCSRLNSIITKLLK